MIWFMCSRQEYLQYGNPSSTWKNGMDHSPDRSLSLDICVPHTSYCCASLLEVSLLKVFKLSDRKCFINVFWFLCLVGFLAELFFWMMDEVCFRQHLSVFQFLSSVSWKRPVLCKHKAFKTTASRSGGCKATSGDPRLAISALGSWCWSRYFWAKGMWHHGWLWTVPLAAVFHPKSGPDEAGVGEGCSINVCLYILQNHPRECPQSGFLTLTVISKKRRECMKNTVLMG